MELIVDGRYLGTLTSWGDLEWSLCWPGYSDELTFDVASYPSILRPGVITSLVWGGEALFTGTLDEPVRGQKLRATGLHRMGENYAALDGAGNLSLAPETVLAAAIARGLPWVKPDEWPNTDVPLDSDAPSTVSQVIDAANADLAGLEWGVYPNREIRRRVRPTAPRLHVRPGGDGLGIAWDNYASTLHARYFDGATYQTVTRTDAAAAARWGHKEAVVSTALNDGATMTLAQAQAIVDSMLAKGRSRPGWTTPIEVEYGAVVNEHGQPVDLPTIRPYELIRVHGLFEDVADLAGQSWVDMPLERIRHQVGGAAVLTPVGLVAPMQDVLSGKRS